jgi:hypothetical protein
MTTLLATGAATAVVRDAAGEKGSQFLADEPGERSAARLEAGEGGLELVSERAK